MQRYKTIVGTIVRVGIKKNNSFVAKSLLSSDFDPIKFVESGEVYMNPKASELILKQIEDGEKKRDISNTIVASKTLRCKQCGSNKISIQTKQTRASDEDQTNIHVCTKCGFEWRRM